MSKKKLLAANRSKKTKTHIPQEIQENANGIEMLDNDEIKSLLVSFGMARQRDNRSFTVDEANAITKWASNVRLENEMLNLVLSGAFLVDIRHGEIAFIVVEEFEDKLTAFMAKENA